MKKYQLLKYVPWLFFPFSILVIILLREGTLMTLGLNFDLFHNICSLSAITGFLRSINFDPFQTILVQPSIIIGINALLLTILLGPFFCGYICPFGTFQRIIKFLGKGLGLKSKSLPYTTHNILRLMKYVFLIMFMFLVFTESVSLYINLDPYHAFIRLFYGGVTLTGGLYLIMVIILSLNYDRPFCNYLCPYGAFFNIVSSIRVFRVKREPEFCINCKICDKECPVNIEVSLSETVKDMNCLSCHACISNCPKEKAIGLYSSFARVIYFIIIFIAIIFTLSFIGRIPISTAADDISQNNSENIDLELNNDISASEDIPLKETSTISVFGNFTHDLIDVTIAKNKNIQAILTKNILDEQIEKERLEAEIIQREEEERLAAEEQAAKEAASKYIYNDGTYKATVDAYRPNMIVQVVIKDDVILSVEILQHNETRSYYNYSVPKLIKAIINSNSPDVNIVSGATYTSIGVKSGVAACLNKAKK